MKKLYIITAILTFMAMLFIAIFSKKEKQLCLKLTEDEETTIDEEKENAYEE